MIRGIVILVTLSFFSMTASINATPNSFGGKWGYAFISKDSLKPLHLFFKDSLNGWFCGYKESLEEVIFTKKYSNKFHWYKTSDGGTSWVEKQFGGAFYVDTSDSRHINIFPNVFYLPSSNVIYILNPGLKADPYSWYRNKYNILYSSDFGMSWERMSFPLGTIINSEFQLLGIIAPNILFMHDIKKSQLLMSQDYGKTFPFVKSDKVFSDVTKPPADTMQKVTVLGFDYSDPLTLTVSVLGSNSPVDSVVNKGLVTLVSTNGGASWKSYQYQLPLLKNEVINGYLQYISGTSHLYCFTTVGVEGHQNIATNRSGIVDYYGVSTYNTSYLYSSDYGKTWVPEHAYGKRRRAFEAVDVGNVWMTVCKEDNIYVPERRAGTIVRTTDNGVTWQEDSSTLFISDVGAFDGRIISFSDPRHGWIAANDASRTYIFRWVADEKSSVEVGEELESFRIKIYPNPAQEETTILLPDTRSIAKVELFDAMGRKVLIEPKITNNTASLSTRTISIGCYYVKVTTTKGTTYIRPVLVMR